MSLFDKIFKKSPKPPEPEGYFQTFNAYTPVFTSWSGRLYEQELVRAAIHARAIHISKLAVEIKGSAKPKLQTKLKTGPNEFQTWGQFLYRLSTMLDVQNTAFIVPIYDEFGQPNGIYPVLPSTCEIVQYSSEPWLKYRFMSSDTVAIPVSSCGIMTKFQYSSDFFGEDNSALNPTMELINLQNQGIGEGVKNSATFRFMAQMNNFAKPEDIEKERKRFNKSSFGSSEGGMLLFPNTYSNIQQIKSSPFVVDEKQMAQIKTNVFDYFGVNEDVLQNKVYGDAWSAFYEGAIEPFSIQFSDVITKMLFTERERASGSELMLTANRLQYLSTSEKLNVSSQMADRGVFNRDTVREIWNLPPLPNGEGERYTIRGEYYLLNPDGTTVKKGDDLTSEQPKE